LKLLAAFAFAEVIDDRKPLFSLRGRLCIRIQQRFHLFQPALDFSQVCVGERKPYR
jgi:hypothetical protein